MLNGKEQSYLVQFQKETKEEAIKTLSIIIFSSNNMKEISYIPKTLMKEEDFYRFFEILLNRQEHTKNDDVPLEIMEILNDLEGKSHISISGKFRNCDETFIYMQNVE